jgi:transposase
MTAPAIARIVREGDQTVRNWLKRWMAEGIDGFQARPMPEPPQRITEEEKEHLLAAVGRRPCSWGPPYSRWTLQRLSESLAEPQGLRVSYERVRQVLKAGENVLSRPQHKVSSPDPEYLVKTSRWKKRETGERRERGFLLPRSSSSVGFQPGVRGGVPKGHR